MRLLSDNDFRGLQAVIFDLDGVLINSLKAMRIAFERAYAEVVGPEPAPFAEYLTHLGRHMPDTLALMGLPAAMYDPFVRESYALVGMVEVFPGVPELLRDVCAAGLRTAVATGKATDRAEHVIRALDLRRHLDEVLGSDAVARGKPAPDMVLEAVRRLKVPAEDAVMVGDSPVDLEAGRAAGVRTIGVTWGEGAADALLALGPAGMATDVAELRALLLCGRHG